MTPTDPDLVRLRAMLETDTGSPEEAEALLPAIARLNGLDIPETDAGTLAEIVEGLLPLMPPRQTRWQRWRRALANWWPGLLLRAQVRVVHSEIWLASLLVIACGTLVTLLVTGPAEEVDLHTPIVIAAPLVTALGIAFIYGPEVDPPLELLMTTPVSPRLLLLARLVLVFGFNLLLGFIGSLILALSNTSLSLWPLILAWLAPMTFLSALAFCLAVVLRESAPSAVICLLLWVIQVVKIPTRYVEIPDFSAAEAQPWLLLTAALLAGIALWLAGQEDRWIGVQ